MSYFDPQMHSATTDPSMMNIFVLFVNKNAFVNSPICALDFIILVLHLELVQTTCPPNDT